MAVETHKDVDRGRRETPEERFDRNYTELLQELRVAQTGTQILFAFLLTTAFTAHLQRSDDFAHVLLAVTLVLTACSAAVLIAPVAVHRATFRRRLKGELVQASSQLARVGLVLMMLAVTGACLLTLDAILDRTVAILVSGGVLGVFVVLWLVLPVVLRRRGTSAPDED